MGRAIPCSLPPATTTSPWLYGSLYYSIPYTSGGHGARAFHCSSSSIGTSSASFPTMAFATFHTCIRLSSAALHKTQGSFMFQLKSAIRFVWPPCMKSLERIISIPFKSDSYLVLTTPAGHLLHLRGFVLHPYG